MPVNKVKNILYIGEYIEWYPRTYVFINGLRKQNISVLPINFRKKKRRKIIKFFIMNFKKLINQNFDLIIYFSFINSIVFLFARILAWIKRIPLVNDYFVSKHLTTIYDRDLIGRRKRYMRPFNSLYYYISDFIECHLSDIVILDTLAHLKYFYETFKIPVKKLKRVFEGVRDDIMLPLNKKKSNNGKITVGFWGSYLLLQGVEYIIKTIKTLEHEDDLRFVLIGGGRGCNRSKELAKKLNTKNIEFKNKVKIEKIPSLISQFDIGLGIFGDGIKTQIVIPNKVLEGIAMKIPMITSDTPAIREVFTNNENIILCQPASTKSLADAIIKLKNNESLRLKIKENAYNLFKSRYTVEKMGIELLKLLNQILNK
ncbi:MAG: glycosyltransferase [Candidatus Hodarchaeota archaeon]